MALISILLSVLAVICMLAGFLLTPIPVVGALFSFGAAAAALAGILLGGKAISQAKQRAQPADVGRLAVILNGLAFVPSVLVAMTCGVCNAFMTTTDFDVQRDWNFGHDAWQGFGGAQAWPPGVMFEDDDELDDLLHRDRDAHVPPDPNHPQDRSDHGPGGPANQADRAKPEPEAPSQLPPPPLPAGPKSEP
jgi:hypothetical protein